MSYGSEVWCQDYYAPGRLVSGGRVVAQALYRRLITPRGTLRPFDETNPSEELAYGIDLPGFVGTVDSAAVRAALPGRIRAELLKDDRVVDVVASVAVQDDGDGTVSYTIAIDVTLADDGEAFTLTISVDELTVTFLGVQEA